MWIKFDGTNKNAAGLFSIGNKTIEVADVAFFLNNGDTTTPSEFFFKGFMQATGASGRARCVVRCRRRRQDAESGRRLGACRRDLRRRDLDRRTLYHNGGAVCDRVLKDEEPSVR